MKHNGRIELPNILRTTHQNAVARALHRHRRLSGIALPAWRPDGVIEAINRLEQYEDNGTIPINAYSYLHFDGGITHARKPEYAATVFAYPLVRLLFSDTEYYQNVQIAQARQAATAVSFGEVVVRAVCGPVRTLDIAFGNGSTEPPSAQNHANRATVYMAQDMPPIAVRTTAVALAVSMINVETGNPAVVDKVMKTFDSNYWEVLSETTCDGLIAAVESAEASLATI